MQARRHRHPTRHGLGCVRACRGDAVARRVRRHPAADVPIDPSAARSKRGSVESGRGTRLGAHPPSSAFRGPDSERIRASCFCACSLTICAGRPLRVCPCTPLPRQMVLAVRDVRGLRPGHVQRDTASARMPAHGHNRSGCLVSSVGLRAPVYEAGGRTFESCTRCQHHRGVVERPQTTGSDPVHVGSNPTAAANPGASLRQFGQRATCRTCEL